jgi:molybdopterin converting factor small subunit
VIVRYFAGARAAAGVECESVQAETVADLLGQLRARGGRLEAVLGVCSLLVDGCAVRDSSARLPDGAGVDVLPPFAGG